MSEAGEDLAILPAVGEHREAFRNRSPVVREVVWPAQPNQVGPTRLLGPELRVELALIPGEIHHEGRTLHIGVT